MIVFHNIWLCSCWMLHDVVKVLCPRPLFPDENICLLWARYMVYESGEPKQSDHSLVTKRNLLNCTVYQCYSLVIPTPFQKPQLNRGASGWAAVSDMICATDGACSSSTSTYGIVAFVICSGYLKPRGIFRTVRQWWCQGSLQLGCSTAPLNEELPAHNAYGFKVAMGEGLKGKLSDVINTVVVFHWLILDDEWNLSHWGWFTLGFFHHWNPGIMLLLLLGEPGKC